MFLHFRWRLGKWLYGVFEWGSGGGLEAGGLEAFQIGRGLVVGAFEAGDEALESEKGILAIGKGIADFGVGAMVAGLAVGFNGGGPELGFGAPESAETPGVVDQLVDELALASVGGLPGLGELVGEGFQFAWIFAGDDLRCGVDAGFESVETDGGFAGSGYGSGRTECVGTVGFYLFQGCHERFLQSECGRRVCGKRRIAGVGIEGKRDKGAKICERFLGGPRIPTRFVDATPSRTVYVA